MQSRDDAQDQENASMSPDPFLMCVVGSGNETNNILDNSSVVSSPNPDELLHPAYQPFIWYVTNMRESYSMPGQKLALSPVPIPSFSMLHAKLAILKRALEQGS